jgi:hypothetical protein
MKIHEHRNLDIHLLWFDPIVSCFMLFLSCFVVEQNVCLIALSLCKIQGMCLCVCVCVYLLLVEILMAHHGPIFDAQIILPSSNQRWQ